MKYGNQENNFEIGKMYFDSGKNSFRKNSLHKFFVFFVGKGNLVVFSKGDDEILDELIERLKNSDENLRQLLVYVSFKILKKH